ncbi:MAG TPA: TraB/GumN family protein, partial [Ferruginibacter sp.]|nr:TraB/GumN family protein [Ferruginibacter sp.]
KLAKENKKELLGLETLAFQASVFDSIPYEAQAVELLKTIDSLQRSKRFFDSMVSAYKNQDMAAMERMMNDKDYGMEDKQDMMLDNRNRNWVGQLKTIMHKDPVFVAVGAGHLPGQAGLIALLRKEGFVVRPLENK